MARETPLWAILTVAGCTLLLAGGQVLMKLGLASGVLDARVLIGIALLVTAGLCMPFALGKGELSVLHPVIALGFVWVTLASALVLQEQFPPLRLAGILVIVGGVAVVGHGGKR